MKIIAIGHGFHKDMLREAPSDEGAPGPDEVAVAMRVAAVNSKDFKLYATKDYARMRDRETDFPLDLGLEAAGLVTAVGRGATGPVGPIREGDEIISQRIKGAYSSRIIIPSSSVIPKPARLHGA